METFLTDIFSILRIPPQFRQQSHIEALMHHTQNVQFFIKLASEHNFSELHKDCCKAMLLEQYSEADFIFNFGEPGDKFYIILSGSVSVKRPTNKKVLISKATAKKLEKYFFLPSELDSDCEVLDKKSPPIKRVSTNTSDQPIKLKSKPENNEFVEEELLILNYFKAIDLTNVQHILERILINENEDFEVEIEDLAEIGVLQTGSSFGELALISDKVRSASIQAREKCSFLVLNKSDFKAILGVLSEKKLQNLIKFLQKFQYFSSWSKSALTKIAYFLEAFKYKKNQVIYKEGDNPDKIFFIRDGEVTIEKKKPSKKSENFPIFSSSPKNFAPKFFQKTKMVQDVKIVIKSKFEAFGGYELVSRLDKRIYSCVCSSAYCELLVMPKINFLNRVPNFDSIKKMIVEENERIMKRFLELSEKEEGQQDRSFTPSELERQRIVHSQTPKSFRISSNSKGSLPKIAKLQKGSFLRKLTKKEILEAVNGRSSQMRVYGSKTNLVNSSFGKFVRKKPVRIGSLLNSFAS